MTVSNDPEEKLLIPSLASEFIKQHLEMSWNTTHRAI